MTSVDPAPGRTVPGGLPPRRVAEAIFPDADVRYVERFDAIADLFDTFDDQRPATCGAYAPRSLLAPLGFTAHDGVDTTREDYLAFLAGTVIEAHEVEAVEAVRQAARAEGLADGEAFDRFPRTWYRWPLRSSDDPVISGTSPTGTARAVSLGSGGALVTLPLPARRADRSIVLEPDRWEPLMDLIEANLRTWRLHPILNYEADQLLDPTSESYTAEALASPDPGSLIPRDRWGVGHFTGVGALWRDPAGRRWVLLLDTYKARGFRGYEPQPADLVRNGLVREDGREGGIILVLPREHLEAARRSVADLGIEVRMWGNGSLEPEGWAWHPGR